MLTSASGAPARWWEMGFRTQPRALDYEEHWCLKLPPYPGYVGLLSPYAPVPTRSWSTSPRPVMK